MIKLDFTVAMAVLISASLSLVFAQWIFYNYFSDDSQPLDYQTNYFLHCPYCGYVFFYYQDEQVCACPRCHSLISRTEDETQ